MGSKGTTDAVAAFCEAAATAQGVSGATIAQGQQSTGKIYFDITGPPPTTVALNNGIKDLLIWGP
jgi:Domain of unknown function (DUF1942)